VQEAHQAGVKLIVWTVNDKESWKRMLDLGVDAICTDCPGQLQEFYSSIS
jgi:glycerophosphoryl diester phosphodiesterase